MDKEQLIPVAEQTDLEPVQVTSDILRYTKKSSKKRWIIGGIAALLASLIAAKLVLPANDVLPVMATPLQKQTLTDMVNLTGMVESAESTVVYPKSSGMVQQVFVKEGDYVEAGTVLAELDTTDLQLQIAQQQATLSKTAKSGEYLLSTAQQSYDQLLQDLDNDTYQELVSARQALDRAQRALSDSRIDLNDHKDDLEYADDVINKLERQLIRAREAFSDVKSYKTDFDNATAPIPQPIQDNYQIYLQKEQEYDDALKALNKANTEYGGDLSVYSKEYRNARLSYESALEAKEIAELNAQRRLETLKQSIEETAVVNDTTSQQIALQMLQNDLANSKIVAPISGTVTAVYAKEGAPAGSGMMFIIENTEELVIKTKVREFDVTSVKPGLPTIVKSDATGEEEFEGEVTFVSPTAAKTADGSVKSEGSVEFETDVALISRDSGLRVGMNVRLNVILNSKDNVYAVPYDAVVTDMDGNDIVYVARTNEEGVTTAEPVTVTTGMETDFYIEISSPDLADGDMVVNDPSMLAPGMPVSVMGGMGGAPVGGGAAGGATTVVMAG